MQLSKKRGQVRKNGIQKKLIGRAIAIAPKLCRIDAVFSASADPGDLLQLADPENAGANVSG